MGRYGGLDYVFLAKAGFLLGLGLFSLGAGGEIVGHVLFGGLPPRLDALCTVSEGIGIVVGLLSPWIFGVVMPLTE